VDRYFDDFRIRNLFKLLLHAGTGENTPGSGIALPGMLCALAGNHCRSAGRRTCPWHWPASSTPAAARS